MIRRSTILAAVAILGTASAALAASKQALSFDLTVAAAGDERTDLQSAVDEARAMVASAAFWTNLKTIASGQGEIWIGPDYRQPGHAAGAADAGGLIALLQGKAGYRAFPASVALSGTYYPIGDDYRGTCANATGSTVPCRATYFGQNYDNMTVVTFGLGRDGRNRPGVEPVAIVIGRQVFDRYRGASNMRRSCTHNTLVHEWTHTFSMGDNHNPVVVDTGPLGAPASSGTLPLASYTVGSVAQCTWLQQRGDIARDAGALKACVAKFGTTAVNSNSC